MVSIQWNLVLDTHWNDFLSYINKTPIYERLIKEAFGQEVFTKDKLEVALAAYLKTLKSRKTAFDKYAGGNKSSLSLSAKRGLLLFTSEKLKCVQCHMPPDFTKVTKHSKLHDAYANIGLYNIANANKYPEEDKGLVEYTEDDKDNGKFRIPSLRNVELTSPYMHDGSVASLSEVIDIYAKGGRGSEPDAVYGNGPAK